LNAFIIPTMLGLHTPPPTMIVAPAVASARTSVKMADYTKENLAIALNPAIGYFDPLGLSNADFWSQGNEATWGFLRAAEIKHGRVAMFAFCGYVVQANGIHFPYWYGPITSGVTPEEQWFNLPVQGRGQIIAFIGFLEFWGELAPSINGGAHYMRGGKPGVYPSWDKFPFHRTHLEKFPLYDPAGAASTASPEKKAKGLLAEINNGRLAMIGIMGFVSESHLPGSVPALTGLVKSCGDLDVMQPFA